MIHEDQVSNDDCSCSRNVGEIANTEVESVECVAWDVEDEVVEVESLDSEIDKIYDLYFQF